MKKGFYAVLVAFAFFMTLMTPSYDATWFDIIKWLLWEAFWVGSLIVALVLYGSRCG